MVPVVMPPGDAERLGVVDDTVDDAERTIAAMPGLLKRALVTGMAVYDIAAALRPRTLGRRASRLPVDAARRHYEGWKRGIGVQRELVKGLKGIIGLVYYEQSAVQRAMGYDPHSWIREVSEHRHEAFADAIAAQQRAVLESDPIPLPGGGDAPITAPNEGPEPWADILGFSHDRRPPNVFSREDLSRDTTLDADVVIAGSGSGGATTAAELAEAGLDVIVLEEGSYWGTPDFTANAAGMIRRMYRDGGASAALGRPPVLFQEGRTVGGSSVINGAMSWRTPERILDGWQAEHQLAGLDAKAMEPYFDRVERRISVALQDPETIGIDSQIIKRGADALNWRYEDNRRNQLHCAGSNNCAFGCPTGGKQSTLITYVPRALRFGARIYSDVRVDKVTWSGSRATGLTGRVVKEDGSFGARVTVRAKLVVVSGGSIQTPALLFRSGFRSASRQLGRNLSLHPNIKVVAFFDEEVRGWEGVHQAYQVREHEEDGIVTLAAVNIPPGILAMSLHHDGEGLGEVLSQYSNAVIAGLLCEDTSRGRIRMAPGGMPVPTYQVSDFDLARIRRGTRHLCHLLLEAGAKRIILPFHGVPDVMGPDDLDAVVEQKVAPHNIELVTVHVMGTARMGGDPKQAVTDGFGQVHGADNLMICDASLFPSAIGVNPAETIQALSTRNAAWVIENRSRWF